MSKKKEKESPLSRLGLDIDKPGPNVNTGPDMNDFDSGNIGPVAPDSKDFGKYEGYLKGREHGAKAEKDKNNNKRDNTDKTTAKDIVNAGADIAGQLAAAHRQSWSGYSGGTTEVSDSSKNFTAVRAPSEDVLTAAERERLKKMSNYG